MHKFSKKVWEPTQNSRPQKGYMQNVLYWRPINIKRPS